MQQFLNQGFGTNTNKGLAAKLKVQEDKISSFKQRVQTEEAEVQRLELQMDELSRKINEEPDKNMVDRRILNAEGTFLMLSVQEIEIVPRGEKEIKISSIMYTIQAEELQ